MYVSMLVSVLCVCDCIPLFLHIPNGTAGEQKLATVSLVLVLNRLAALERVDSHYNLFSSLLLPFLYFSLSSHTVSQLDNVYPGFNFFVSMSLPDCQRTFFLKPFCIHN